MAATSNSPPDQYHYTENGITKGPLTAKQLRDLAQAGQIRPQTLVWKQGYPGWVPAGSVKGLLPQVQLIAGSPPSVPPAKATPGLPRRSPPEFPNELAHTPQTRMGVLIGVIAGAVLVLGGTVALVIVLLRNNAGDSQGDDHRDGNHQAVVQDKSREKDGTVNPVDPIRPQEFKATELLEKYDADPRKTLTELEGKTVIVKVEGRWEVEELKKCIVDDQLIIYFFKTANRDLNFSKRGEVIQLIFPLIGKDKISVIAKVKGRAEKLRPGETVVWRLRGTLATFAFRNEKFLLLKDTFLE